MSKSKLPDFVDDDIKRVADKIGGEYRDALRRAFDLPVDSDENESKDKPDT